MSGSLLALCKHVSLGHTNYILLAASFYWFLVILRDVAKTPWLEIADTKSK